MRRFLVISSLGAVLTLAPASLFAQTEPQTQQPAEQAATQPAQEAPAPPKVPLTSQAGILLVQIKPEQTAVFEEMVSKIFAGLAKTEDPLLKQQAASLKIFKAAEPFAQNALYVVLADPAVAQADYDLFQILFKVLTDEEKRSPDFKAMWDRYVGAFAAGLSRLSLTPITQ